MAHKHSIYDTDPHFKIDPATRAIQNESGKVKLMQYDHKSERFTFEIPRFIDGHDMSLCNLVTIDFDNVDSSTKAKNSDVYEVKDLQLSPASENVVIFSWLIEDSATQFKGELKFSISFQCIADNGTVDYDFGTDIHYGITIGERLRNATSVVEKGSNILAQWKADLFGIGDTEEAKLLSTSQEQQSDISEAGQTQVDAVNARGAAVLETIPDDYEALSALADENARIKAGAIVLNAEGESIVVADSANAYLPGMKLYGKSEQKSTTGANLCSLNNITFTQMKSVELEKPIPAGTYFLSLVATSKDTDDTTCVINFYNNETSIHGARFTRGERIIQQVTFGQDITHLYCYASMSFLLGENDAATFSNIMVAVDENAEYEPYSGGKPSPNPEYPQEIESVENPEVHVYGKNFLKVDGVLSFTHVKSIPTYIPPGTYTLSFISETHGGDKYPNFRFYDNKVWNELSPDRKSVVVTLTKPETQIYIYSNGTSNANSEGVSATITGLMVSVEGGAYEPYKGYELSMSRTLPGIPVTSGGNYTDSNGQQWICDEVDFERGVYIQRVELKTFTLYKSVYEFSPLGYRYQHHAGNYFTPGNACLCRTLPYNADVGTDIVTTDGVRINNSAGYIIAQYTDLDGTADSIDLDILYILATPIETPLSDAELLAFKALRSNKPATTILNDSGMFMSVDYVADTKTYIDNKIAEIVKNS